MVYAGVASLLQTLDYLIDILIRFSEINKPRVHRFVTKIHTEADSTQLLSLCCTHIESSLLLHMVSVEPLIGIAGKQLYTFLLCVGQMGLDDLSFLSSLLHRSRDQPLIEGECSYNAATNQEKHLMELLDGIRCLSSKTLTQGQEFVLEYRKFNEVVLALCAFYKDIAFLYGDLRSLLSYLDDSWNVDEEQLKRVKEVSYRAKHVIEESLEHCQIEPALELMSVELMYAVHMGVAQVDSLHLFRNLQEAIRMDDIQRIHRCLVQSREEINCIKDGFPETISKPGYIDNQVPQTNSNQEIMVGFGDEDLFLERLVNNATQPGLQIFTIVGMGGIGKTTLAKKVFNHQYVIYHFDCLAWITVSQNYDKRNLLLHLLNSFAQLAEIVYKSLKCKRYLIVMDDMWETKAWNDVKRCFPDDKTGSRILITSRLVGLANSVSPNTHTHFMNLFDAEQSWALLEKLVCQNAVCSPQLKEVGREIAKRCRGLPLAIVVISGVLCSTHMTLIFCLR